ncbi:MAG: transglutaminase-like domain-containing protein [Planctomycetota bacterium]|nr:transglutaminase-like domain-containing protein [Planctomycetota bacterium]
MMLRKNTWSNWKCLAVLLLLLPGSLVQAGEVLEDLWYGIELGGGRIGWQHNVVEVDGDRRTSTTDMEMTFKRGQMEIKVAIKSTWKATTSGKPVSVKMIQDMSVSKTIVKWTFEPDGIHIMETSGGPPVTRNVPLPKERWLLPYDVQQYFLERARAGDEEILVKMMSPEVGPEVITVTYTKIGKEKLTIEGREHDTTIWNMVNSAMPEVASKLWYSTDGVMLANETDIGFGVLRMTLEDKATAEQEPTAPEVFFNLMIEPNQPIPDPWKARRVIMRVRPKKDSEVDLELPSLGYQSIAGREDDSVTIVVDMANPQPATAEEIADDSFLGQSVMIDPEDVKIVELHDEAMANAPEDASPMERALILRTYVLNYIDNKNLQTAFASASEVARNRSGDCSEHGVLLAALLRADGIPARVVTGLVYVPGIGEKGQGVFGWHMWDQALIDGQWVDLDATLPVQFSGGHITTSTSALAKGTGASDMAGLIALLGNIEIDVIRVDHE